MQAPIDPTAVHRAGALMLKLCASAVLLIQAACSSSGGGDAGRPSSATPPPPTGTVVHGPFEIVAKLKSISTGTFPNQGGNPFATRKVSEFEVRWRGKSVAMSGGSPRFWRVLRLDGAPRPALLLVTTGFVLATEDAAGQLQLTPIKSESSSLAEVQWLDAANGQPGRSETFGIEAVSDLQAGTLLAGGRWLRLGSRSIIEVPTLRVFAVDPWVPMVPGVPITSISREGDDVRAFSPGRTAYVLAAAGIDYSRADQAQAYGLLVVDVARGTATELRADRRRFRFADLADVDAAWIDHHYTWQRGATGQERLLPREHFAPWPWRARMQQPNPGSWQLEVPRIDGTALLAVLRRLLEREAGAQLIDTSTPSAAGLDFVLGGCSLRALAFGAGSRDADSHKLLIWPNATAGGAVLASPAPACEPALRQLAVLIDAELATRRHDGLIKFD